MWRTEACPQKGPSPEVSCCLVVNGTKCKRELFDFNTHGCRDLWEALKAAQPSSQHISTPPAEAVEGVWVELQMTGTQGQWEARKWEEKESGKKKRGVCVCRGVRWGVQRQTPELKKQKQQRWAHQQRLRSSCQKCCNVWAPISSQTLPPFRKTLRLRDTNVSKTTFIFYPPEGGDTGEGYSVVVRGQRSGPDTQLRCTTFTGESCAQMSVTPDTQALPTQDAQLSTLPRNPGPHARLRAGLLLWKVRGPDRVCVRGEGETRSSRSRRQ